MIRLVAEAAFALGGIGRILLFRPDWRERFNLTEAGLYRSFGAALLSLPAYALMQLFFDRLTSANAPELEVWWYAVDLARLWLLFPIVAALAVSVTGLRKDFAAWVTVHNWAVLAQILLVTIAAAAAVSGIGGQGFVALFFGLFYPAFLVVLHLLIAFATLRGPWSTVAGAAALTLVADFGSRFAMTALTSQTG